MSLRDDLARVVARDARYTIHAYFFVFEALEYTKVLKAKARAKSKLKSRKRARHVSGRELCEGARKLALRDYGLMALAVLARWGIRSTSDIGEIVYNLIASGDLEKTPNDSRTDFDDVYEFEAGLRQNYVMILDDVLL
ncbi:hypothetical protein EP7_002997 [Isosphaeraceae bacterium EP7]